MNAPANTHVADTTHATTPPLGPAQKNTAATPTIKISTPLTSRTTFPLPSMLHWSAINSPFSRPPGVGLSLCRFPPLPLCYAVPNATTKP